MERNGLKSTRTKSEGKEAKDGAHLRSQAGGRKGTALLHVSHLGQDEQAVPSESPVQAHVCLQTPEPGAPTAEGLLTSQKFDFTGPSDRKYLTLV